MERLPYPLIHSPTSVFHSEPEPARREVPGILRLPLQFDVAPIEADLARLPTSAWTPHFNTERFEGDWSGVPLLAPVGETHPIRLLHPDPTCTEFVSTEFLANCPGVRAVLDQLRCTLRCCRFLRLAVGSEIKEHQDMGLAFEDEEVRIHIPILTHPAVRFYLDDRLVEMSPGEAWYLNLNLPHRVSNPGPTDRVHLVIDCIVNDWIRNLFDQGEPWGTHDKVTNRPITPADCEILAEIFASTRSELFAQMPLDDAQKAVLLRHQFEAQDNEYRARYPDADLNLLIRKDAVLGRLYVDRQTDVIHLIEISLLPRFQRTGVGTRVLRDLMDEAERSGLPLQLFVESSNPAQEFYRQLGFYTLEEDGVHHRMEWRAPVN